MGALMVSNKIQKTHQLYQISAETKEKAITIARDIDRIEKGEHSFLKVVLKDLDEVTQDSRVINKEYDDIVLLNAKKDSLIKSIKILNTLNDYSSKKRGILPRGMGAGEAPIDALASARKRIEEWEEGKRLRELQDEK
jgi:hypothetical protein